MNCCFQNIKAALFDLDGTLVDTDIDFHRMKQEVLRLAAEYGIDNGRLGNSHILEIIDEAASFLENDAADSFKKAASGILEEIEISHAENGRTVDGAEELIAALREKGCKIGIVTRNCRAAAETSIRKSSLYAEIVLTRDDVKNTKPHPSHLQEALRRLGVATRNAVMVGDYTLDVEAGKAAGMKTIGFLRPHREPDFFSKVKPDAVVTSLRELIDVIVCADR